MRLPRILNQCHPIPGFVYGPASFAQDEQAVLIPVRPRKRSAAICSGCHQPAPGYDQSPTPRRFEFIGFWGYLVFLVYCMRRVNCKQCGVLVEEVPWGMGKHSSTKVHMHFLGHWARKLSDHTQIRFPHVPAATIREALGGETTRRRVMTGQCLPAVRASRLRMFAASKPVSESKQSDAFRYIPRSRSVGG